MDPTYRLNLLAVQNHVEQLIAECEGLLVGPTDDEIMLDVSK